MDDFYSLLGISHSSGADEIKRAYREKTRKYHPDVNSDPIAPILFRAITEAYECLSDSEARASYDAYWKTKFLKASHHSEAEFAPPSREERIFPKEDWNDIATIKQPQTNKVKGLLPILILLSAIGVFAILFSNQSTSLNNQEIANSSAKIGASSGLPKIQYLAPMRIRAHYSSGGATIYWIAPPIIDQLTNYQVEISISAGPWKLIATVPTSQLFLEVKKVNSKGWTSFRISSTYSDGQHVGGNVFGLPGEYQ